MTLGHRVTTRSETDSTKEMLVETIRHEEKLIDTRLTWMLTFQGFLFASASLAADEPRKRCSKSSLGRDIDFGAVLSLTC